jgi:hypothetical protein
VVYLILAVYEGGQWLCKKYCQPTLTYMTKTSSDIVPYRLQEVSRLQGLPELDCENHLHRWHVLHIRRHGCVEIIGSEGSYCATRFAKLSRLPMLLSAVHFPCVRMPIKLLE